MNPIPVNCHVRMRSSRVKKKSLCLPMLQSQQSWIQSDAYEAVLNNVHEKKKIQNIPRFYLI
jgi:hypothetical protein